jgi:CRP-like cAMP-binding protein
MHFVGSVDLLKGRETYAFAQALTPVTAVSVPASACVDLLKAEPARLLLFAQHLAEIVQALTESLSDLVLLDLERRLARTLVVFESPRTVRIVDRTELSTFIASLRR